MIAFFIPTCLAQSELESLKVLGLVILFLGAVAAALALAVNVFDRLKSKGLSATDLQHFATKDELNSLVTKVETIERENNFQSFATQRALGRIESSIEHLENSTFNKQ